MNERTPHPDDHGPSGSRPTGLTRSPGRVALALAVVGLGLVVLAGCGRARRDATVAPSSTPSTTAVPASTVTTAAGATPSSAVGPAVDPQQLAQVTAELGSVDSQLAGVTGDVDAATSAINSQEGDPTK